MTILNLLNSLFSNWMLNHFCYMDTKSGKQTSSYSKASDNLSTSYCELVGEYSGQTMI